MTLNLSRLGDHPILRQVIENNYPFCICTDDPGLFDTDAVLEWNEVISSFNLSLDRIYYFMSKYIFGYHRQIHFIFGTDDDKDFLNKNFAKYEKLL